MLTSVGLAVLLVTTVAASPAPGLSNTSGLVLLGPATPPDPLPEPVAKALSDALWVAQTNADNLGYPSVDRATGTLIVRVVNDSGETAAQAWILAGAQLMSRDGKIAPLAAPTVPVRIERVTQSYGQLERIKHESIGEGALGLPDSSAIVMTAPDYENNRVIVTVDRPSDRLFNGLAGRYGTHTVAVRVDADVPRLRPATREADYSPFWGGAHLNVPPGSCSSGFSWGDGTNNYMLLAGHCVPDGGAVSTTVQSMGTVAAGSRENWKTGPGNGTQYFTGQSTYRGDLALVTIEAGKNSSPYIYRESTGYGLVKEMWYRSPVIGDQYCTGGYKSGELCGWYVTQAFVDYTYTDGTTARNITAGGKTGSCLIGGDSGGPTYTVRSDLGIAAKGIISGIGGNCFNAFTDIWHAWYALPGTLKLG